MTKDKTVTMPKPATNIVVDGKVITLGEPVKVEACYLEMFSAGVQLRSIGGILPQTCCGSCPGGCVIGAKP